MAEGRRPDHEPDEEDPEEESSQSAADLPTAVWDDGALRELGLDATGERSSRPEPATRPEPGRDEPSVELTGDSPQRSGRPGQRQPARPRGRGPAWLFVLAFALAAGLVSYLLIRLLLS